MQFYYVLTFLWYWVDLQVLIYKMQVCIEKTVNIYCLSPDKSSLMLDFELNKGDY